MKKQKKIEITHNEIIDATMKFFSDTHICFSEVKDGPTYGRSHLRMDIVAIKKTWSPVTIVAAEAKTSHADFVNDEKWPEYMKMCNKFYWACPTKLIKKDEIDPKCGLIYINPETKRARTAKAAIYRPNDPDPWMLLYLLLWREEGLNRPKRSDDKKRRMEDLLDDMKKRHKFGTSYARFTGKKLHEASTRVVVAEEKIKLCQKELDGMKNLKKFVSNSGIPLEKLQNSGVLDDLWALSRLVKVRGSIERTRDELTKVLNALPETDEEK